MRMQLRLTVFTLANWSPSSTGSYSLTFPGGDVVQVETLQVYGFKPVSSSYVTIAGTNLNLGDDSVAQITSPFSISYGGGNFIHAYVSSNGTISFTEAYDDYYNGALPPTQFPPITLPQPTTLIAPWWQDLFPVKNSSQNVFWQVVGSAPNRQLVVEWRDVQSFACNGDTDTTIKFQAVFFEGKSDVQFNYADTSFSGNCSTQDHGRTATVGLQQSQASAEMYSFGTETVGDGLSILWTTPASTTPNPLPVLTSITPTSVARTQSTVTVTATGSNFVPGSRIQNNNSNRVTTYVNSTKLTALLDANDIDSNFGAINIGVFTPGPGGGTSQQLPITVLNPVPTISSISPNVVSAGGLSFILTVKGTGFEVGNSAVYWNGQPLLYSTFIDHNTLLEQISYGTISAAGTAQITVQTSKPGGGTSNAVPLTISAAQAGGGGFSNVVQSPSQILAQERQHLAVDNSGQLRETPTRQAVHPMRFLGWNYGRKMGPAYFKYFARAHGGTAIPAQNGQTGVMQTAEAGRKNISSAASAISAGPVPGFGLRPTLPADFIPTSVASGDFNHDGKLDWAVTNGGSNTIWIYLGKGDGNSQLPTIIPLNGAGPIQIITADIRKTGAVDLVVAEADSGTVGILLGNNDGTFQPEKNFVRARASTFGSCG